jgi:hypothetical protein
VKKPSENPFSAAVFSVSHAFDTARSSGISEVTSGGSTMRSVAASR